MRRLLPLRAGLPTPHDPRPKVSARPAARSGDPRRTAILVALLNLLLASPALARQATLHMRDGRVWQGDFAFHTADWLVITPPIGSAVSLALANVNEISFAASAVTRTDAPRTVLMMRNGSAAPVVLRSVDDTATKFSTSNRLTSIPTLDVARILFQPVAEDRFGKLPPRQQGVLFPSGDFLEGKIVRCDGKTLQLNSVLFGTRTFNLPSEAAALVFRDPTGSTNNLWQVRIHDGSVFYTDTFSPEVGKVIIRDPTFGAYSVPLDQLRGIRRNRP